MTTACVAFVTEPARGTVCRFQGEDALCGQCVRQRCQDAVNACCSDGACGATMSALDACAATNDASCTALLASPSALGACVASRCAGACQPSTGASATACKELPLAPGAACSCQTSAEPNAFTCKGAVFPGTRCCAPKGWPNAGLQCSCRRVSCNPTADGCFCSLVDYAPEQESCSGAFCCVVPDRDDACTCRSTPCRTGERAVDACNVGVMGCGVQTEQTSCSIRN